MTQPEILEALQQMPRSERLAVVAAALQLVQEDLQASAPPPWVSAEELTAAAARMVPYYVHDDELTAFTALDGEDFYQDEAR